jgi:hypothetical protein
MKDFYQCKKCGWEWNFCPEDYEEGEELPDICPLCQMPTMQMIKEVFLGDGIIEVIRRLILKLK